MIRKERVSVKILGEIKEDLVGNIPLSIALGYEQEVLVLLTDEQPPLIGGQFPATVTERLYSYQVVRLKNDEKTIIELPAERWNYHFVQPIDTDHVLVVGARSRYRGDDDIEENAHVFNYSGRLVRTFCLGDGIEHVHVTRNQSIWTGYFDEGTCGSYGWDEPIGSSGLVGWDRAGRKMDSLEEDKEFYIFECLALNSNDKEEIYFFFSIEGMIGVRKDGVSKYYGLDDLNFRSFAVKGDEIVAYTREGDGILLKLDQDNKRCETVHLLEFIKPDGTPISPQAVSNRENMLVFLDNGELYLYVIE
ncbi:hypothetical protein [Sporosarcina koreensis]|uniref:hypothetical protein n=1 Tax=Sporosarcina koreensis TaxID=334735 RepID=UPI00058AC9C5|nr:hypothetical protein [Sporosarcina koreensis]